MSSLSSQTANSLLRVIDEYCNCIFQVVDHAEFEGLTDDCKAFCLENYDYLSSLTPQKLANASLHITTHINTNVVAHMEQLSEKQEHIYANFSRQNLDSFIDALKQEWDAVRATKKKKRSFPDLLISIKDQVAMQYRQAQILSVFFQTKPDSVNERLQQYEAKAEALHADFNAKTDFINKAFCRVERKMKTLETRLVDRSITVLGIFVAVVSTISGMFSFSSSILSNISSSSIYRLLLIAIIIGLISINLLFGLFRFLTYIRDKSRKRARTISPILVNMFCIILLIVLAVAWRFGWAESRNKDISNCLTSSETISSETSNSFCLFDNS